MLIPMNSTVDLTGPENSPRLLYAGDDWQGDSQPQMLIEDDGIRIMGDLDKGIVIDPMFGSLIQGPCSLSEMPNNIRIASYWAFNPMLLACMGSSAAMNIPVLVPTTPPILAAKKGFSSVLGL